MEASRLLAFGVVVAVAVVGCAEDVAEGDTWTPPASDAMGVYEGVGDEGCAGGLKPGTKELGERLEAQFDTTFGGYSCRANTANAKELSLHAVGRALDVDASGELGDRIADYVVTHASELGVQLVIWNHTLWRITPDGATSRPYTGPNPHVDHVHVEVDRATATPR
ncbi:MAG: hypothetical protein KIT84_15490 [Labilithrix sp.]|nr:hypothetical protein [Labilithrix sp.]MCW5812429.1 hypothetical protein [Labilithrix sp.]